MTATAMTRLYERGTMPSWSHFHVSVADEVGGQNGVCRGLALQGAVSALSLLGINWRPG